LNSRYAGNNEKIEEKVRIWLHSQKSFAAAKVAMPEPLRFVHTRSAKKFLSALEFAQAMPDVAVIVGAPGTGKTTACVQYKATHPNVWHLTAEPLISACGPVMKYLREAVGLPEMETYRIPHAMQMKIQNTQGLIIVDEAQHLSTEALDQLRSVHDRCGVGLALVGSEELWRRVDGGGRKAAFAQLFSRVGIRVAVGRSSVRDIEVLLDAAGIHDEKQRAVLKTIGQKPGALRGIVKTLRAARKVAAGAGEALGEQHILQAWQLNCGDGGVA
jgi:DNA transposition AAA+ family ATPase